MRIVFAGGGTGGHIYPALAVADAVREKRPETDVLFIGGTRGIERNIAADAGYPVRTIPVMGMPRRLSPMLAVFALRLGVSYLRSLGILRGFRPTVLLATGGYVAAPPVMAALTIGVPVMMQEQNSFPGIVTKRFARFAKLVFLGMPAAKDHMPGSAAVMVTGNPVRSGIAGGDRAAGAVAFGIDPARKTLLVFGGSQGARAINVSMGTVAGLLADAGIQVIWQTGDADYERYRNCARPGLVTVAPYIDRMRDAYAASDVAVCRAGAMTIAELELVGLPGIFVPLPTAAEDHQTHNARSLVEAGAACLIPQAELDPGRLYAEVTGVLDPERLRKMGERMRAFGTPGAAGSIAGMIIETFGVN